MQRQGALRASSCSSKSIRRHRDLQVVGQRHSTASINKCRINGDTLIT
jgi:hypothetical protein